MLKIEHNWSNIVVLIGNVFKMGRQKAWDMEQLKSRNKVEMRPDNSSQLLQYTTESKAND